MTRINNNKIDNIMKQSEIRQAIELLTGQENGILSEIDDDILNDLREDADEQNPHFASDEYNPAFLFSGTSNALLGMIAKGEINLQDLAMRILEGRGYDQDGNWVRLKSN